MKFINKIPALNLQMFADGGAGGTGDGGTGQGTGVTGAAAVSQNPGVKGNSLANVKYGVQEDGAPAAEVKTAEPAPDPNAEFEKLIKGQYKEQYDSRVRDTVQKRLKGANEISDKYNALVPTLEILGKKYGVDPTDPAALAKAIEEDDSFFEQAAVEAGMDVDKYKAFYKVQKENETLRKQMKDQQTKQNAERLMSQWVQEGETVKQVYPSFNLEAEMQNPEFVNLLRSNVNLRTAYEVMHRDEVIAGAMQFAAKTVEQKVTNKIAANGARPVENGLGGQAPSLTKSDVSQLSPKDLKEIQRRVANGERITFTQPVRSP